MNKGVANLWRYFQVGTAANRRYLEALAAALLKGKGVAALDALCPSPYQTRAPLCPLQPPRPRRLGALPGCPRRRAHDRRVPQRRPGRKALPPSPGSPEDAQRRCARVSRLIAKLRGHGLVAKVPHLRLYRVTPYGQKVMTAALAVHDDTFPEVYLRAA